MCDPDMGTNALITCFQSTYGYSGSESAAGMGAHTVGVMRRAVLGFDGRNGWVTDNLRFDNEYNLELVGRGGDLNLAPNWFQQFVPNDGDMPDRWQWVGFPGGR
jgi:hypothetical protein